jgi:hypothetical protein
LIGRQLIAVDFYGNRSSGSSCGLLFTAQPEAPAFMLAGASGWVVNGSPQDATKSIVCKAKGVDLEQSL